METRISVAKAAPALILASYLAGGGGTIFADTLKVTDNKAIFTTEAGEVTEWTDGKLARDVSVTNLIFNANAITLDLNGHSLTFVGEKESDLKVDSGGATVTDSRTSGEASTASFTVTATDSDANYWKTQFQRFTFSGNLKLYVKGRTNSKDGFQNASNTHTGGTILDAYGIEGSQNVPRMNNGTAFGSGMLTMRNGTQLLMPNNVTPEWTGIAVDEGCAYFTHNGTFTLSAGHNKLVVSGEAALVFNGNQGLNIYDWDTTGVQGSIRAAGGSGRFQLDSTGFPNGTLDIASGSDARYSKNRVETPVYIKRLAGSGILRHVKIAEDAVAAQDVSIGGGDFAGDICRDGTNNNGNGDWNLIKTGDETLTLTATNHYHGTTTLTGGTLKLDGAGTLDWHRTKSETATDPGSRIYFNGGTLAFGKDFIPSAIPLLDLCYTTNGNPAKIYADCNLESARSIANITNGLTKTGSGALKLTNTSIAIPYPVTVGGGTLAITQYSGSLTNGAIAIAKDGVFHVKTRNTNAMRVVSGENVSGGGTLRLEANDNEKPGGWRVYGSWANFTGTLEFTGDMANPHTSGCGLMKNTKDNDLLNVSNLSGVTLVYSYNPSTDLLVDKGEVTGDLTLGALQILYPHEIVTIGSARKTITFGAKEGSESVLNGQIENRFTLVKTGNTPLTIGSGFKMRGEDQSGYTGTLSVQAGTLVADADLSGDFGCTLDIRSGVKISGAGKVSLAQFNAAAAGGKTTYAVKVTEGGAALTVDGEVNLDDVTLDLDLSEVDPSDTAKTYTLLKATALTGTADPSRLADLNKGLTKGRWKFAKMGGNLVLTYQPHGLVIYMR